MPELPEIEVLKRSIKPHITGAICTAIKFNRDAIRYPIPKVTLGRVLKKQAVTKVMRRSKYLIIETAAGQAYFHMGMTGNLLYSQQPAQEKHNHLVLKFERQSDQEKSSSGSTFFINFVDPRRFGFVDAQCGHELEEHKLFQHLGPEPLQNSKKLPALLMQKASMRRQPIKNFIMDAKNIVGVGNIYACESLYRSGIHPCFPAQQLSEKQWHTLVEEIVSTLREAIKSGGSTIRDFQNPFKKKGYFSHSFKVYDRQGKACITCLTPVENIRLAGRSSFFCPKCQAFKPSRPTT